MRRTLPDRIDVLVIGAGTGGCVAARLASEAGLRVALVERSSARDVGRKVCGNAVTDDGVETMRKYGAAPTEAEVAAQVWGGTLILDGGRVRMGTRKSGVILNRLTFGQRVLADAVAAGVELIDGCSCVGWTDRDSATVRLRWGDDEEADVAAKIVIDASGYGAVLTRHRGPSHQAAPLDRNDVGIAYREIAPTTEDIEDPRQVVVVVGPEGARGGFGWVFPMGDRLVNVGVGTSLFEAGSRFKDCYRKFSSSLPGMTLAEPVDTGAGLLPLRRPLPSLVGDRFMTIGDAGRQANPLHGGGIAPSVLAGGIAADVAVVAIGAGDTSTAGLWSYNVRFMREVGAQHATHEVLRRFLDSLADRDVHFIVHELAKRGAMEKVMGARGARSRLAAHVRLVATIAKRPLLVASLIRAATFISATQSLYLDYPETPSRFDSWLGQVERQKAELARATSGGRR